ncbi:helix-turn-helix domain-containing protein [Falsarthrobacter nasiphocae]|uniref:Transcriptional regulator with XRE-family HTH domain n=1 Tax=Falsarthrobacter nasiphocae TaxID=189863 RepID=A0AAE3YEH2_9MICC|nr:helix-turn-helix domain-containing protein [Falsarthrobacter nasiphocae]MDR6891914.1 transcriptional regulator with XRE-family HTH domain [Falsarthrobacter nasiphocae]
MNGSTPSDPRPSDPPSTARIGQALREARAMEGLSQRIIAELSGISERTLRDIERGSPSPSLGSVLAVAETLGMTLEARR